MRKYFVLSVAALLLATGAQAAEETGRVVAIDPAANTFTIQTDDGDRIVYRTAPTTRVMRQGATLQIGDVAVGTRVQVTAPDVQDPALRIASNLELVDAEVAADLDTDDDDRVARAERRLPSTASPVPLIGLAGAGLVGAGLLVRRFQR